MSAGAAFPPPHRRSLTVPYASIKITREPRASAEQKAQLIKEVTASIVRILDRDPETTFVVIEEIDTDAWGVGGESAAVRRTRRAAVG